MFFVQNDNKENLFFLKVVLAIALTCVVAKPGPSGLLYTSPSLYTAPSLYSAPLAAAPLATSFYNAPLTYSSNYYRPYTYASPYGYNTYNTLNYRAPLTYSALPATAYIQ